MVLQMELMTCQNERILTVDLGCEGEAYVSSKPRVVTEETIAVTTIRGDVLCFCIMLVAMEERILREVSAMVVTVSKGRVSEPAQLLYLKKIFRKVLVEGALRSMTY